jgi:hypothetical protein
MHALLETVQRVISLQSVPWLYISNTKAACAPSGNIKLQDVMQMTCAFTCGIKNTKVIGWFNSQSILL